MKQTKRLGLHSHILPTMRRLAANEVAPHSSAYQEQLDGLLHATVFDCRRMPLAFVRDTGKAEAHESMALSRKVRLPFPVCYFEFGVVDDGDDRETSGIAILALETRTYIDVEGVDFMAQDIDAPFTESVTVYCFNAWEIWRDLDEALVIDDCRGEFQNGAIVDGQDESEFFCFVNGGNPAAECCVRDGSEILLGVLALLNEQLLASEFQPDPQAEWNRARAKRGRLPLSSDTRVLTINTAAVRKAVSKSPEVGLHESPRLHWRRGHHRVLHRGSEYEAKTWVRKCLVGDPARGAIHKDYRLVWQAPMLQASA